MGANKQNRLQTCAPNMLCAIGTPNKTSENGARTLTQISEY